MTIQIVGYTTCVIRGGGNLLIYNDLCNKMGGGNSLYRNLIFESDVLHNYYSPNYSITNIQNFISISTKSGQKKDAYSVLIFLVDNCVVKLGF